MLITIKFGGTSVGDAERIRSAAELVAGEVRKGNQVVVVTSAMSGVTNKLVAMLAEVKASEADEQERVTGYYRFAKALESDHAETAREGRNRWLALNDNVFKATGKMMEKYNVVDAALTTGGGEYPNQDGFGWTNGVYLRLAAEKARETAG